MNIKKIIAINLNRVFKNHVYVSKHGPAKGLKRRGGLAFLPGFVPRSTDMEREEAFIEELNLTDRPFTTSVAIRASTRFSLRARWAGKVASSPLRPNPNSYEQILVNVELNNLVQVEVRNIGLGEQKG